MAPACQGESVSLETARRVLRIEMEAIGGLLERLDRYV